MNAVEIEEAVSALAAAPFNPEEFPFRFLEAFDFNQTAVNKLRAGGKGHNKSDVPGGLLTGHRNNIHLATCPTGKTGETLRALLASPATARQKAKFALATDGQTIEAQNLADEAEPPLVCDFAKLGDHFGYFLPLAGISAVKAIRENAFDIKATGRLNRLYVELIRHNPGWDAAARREQLNHFFARLIFCFFAEDTGIFHGEMLFTTTLQQMTDPDGSNTAGVLAQIFRAMDLPIEERGAANLRPWAEAFPYVNGGLFSGAGGDDVPRFSKIARSYLLHVGTLDWKKINPDIFGSMIQAVADDAERGALGMHYTSVPNILKVLNPLFLDDLRAKLIEAGDSPRKLLNLRRRLARIRIFDPACGSGNFLVIAYKEMRAIEAEINRRRGEPRRSSDIPLTNFRGIEIRHFAVEIARLALIIAEFQCNALYLGEQQARLVFLPLDKSNWITHGNALRLDWLGVCPPGGTGVKLHADDLFNTPLDQPEINFENEGGETYICGNPPYVGDKKQNKLQKADLKDIFAGLTSSWKSLDYICGFIYKAYAYICDEQAACAFVSTNSVVQGQHVPRFWSLIIDNVDICFAVTSFTWSNLAANKAGVSCVIVGLCRPGTQRAKFLLEGDTVRYVDNITPYLTAGRSVIVQPLTKSLAGLPKLTLGNVPKDDGGLLMSRHQLDELKLSDDERARWTRMALGSTEFIQGKSRYCLWLNDDELEGALAKPAIASRVERVRAFRKASVDPGMAMMAAKPHQFREMNVPQGYAVIVPRVSSEEREYLPCGIVNESTIVTDRNYAIYSRDLWCLAVISSRLHHAWIATVCVRMRTDFSYSNTLGWNTFPVPALSEGNRAELARRAEDILLAREANWPATIAEMYDPAAMDSKYPDLRAAHDRNDESLERIYIGRRFKNDTERLETLFKLYTQMAEKQRAKKPNRLPGRKPKGR